MTSMPASRSARAMIFAPRSCPSRPGFATRILSFRSATFRSHDQVLRFARLCRLVDTTVHPLDLEACSFDERNHFVPEIVTDEVAGSHRAAVGRDEGALRFVATVLRVEGRVLDQARAVGQRALIVGLGPLLDVLARQRLNDEAAAGLESPRDLAQ